MSKVKITKIELTTKDGKVVELSLDEAKDLHAQLADLFGQKTVYIPSAPIYVQPYQWPWSRPYWQIGYSGGTAGEPTITSTSVYSAQSGLNVNYSGTLEA